MDLGSSLQPYGLQACMSINGNVATLKVENRKYRDKEK